MAVEQILASRSEVGYTETSLAEVRESPEAKRVTSCPLLTSSSVNSYTTRSVPPYFFAGTRSIIGAICAIQAAKMLGLPLILAGKLDDWQLSYFKAKLKPHLSDTIRYIGEVTQAERNELMRNALAFLHPISWLEPFGLTLIEAMACGTPVVAFNKGSIPEIVMDGKTGFVCDSFACLLEGIKKVTQIDRRYCREYALTNFNPQRMTDGYEAVYRKILRSSFHALPSAPLSVPHLRKPLEKNDYVDL